MSETETVSGGNDVVVWNENIREKCDNFTSAIQGVMDHLGGNQATRDSAVDTAKEDFSGYFSELFDQNTTIQKEDKCQLCNTLEVLKTGMEEAKEAAKAEQDRRDKARAWAEDYAEWEEEQEKRKEELAIWGMDWTGEVRYFFSEKTEAPAIEDSDLVIPDSPKIASPDTVTISEHTTPSPGEAADRITKTETSSAVPDNLSTFVTTCSGLDDDLEKLISSLDGKWQEMEGAWLWGKEDTGDSASTILVGGMEEFISVLKQYNEANRNDAKWVNIIKEAFEEAGSQGQGGGRTLSN